MYRIADRCVQSDLPLPELQHCPDAVADWRVHLEGAAPAPRRGPAYHHWTTPRGYRWASFSRDAERLVMHFAQTATFVVDETERSVSCIPIGRTGPGALRPVLLNQVFPLLLGSDRLVLHASAVSTPKGALVFAGAPGLGKSTLASALAQRGLPLITDDFLVVDQSAPAPCAVPSRLESRLWPDSVRALVPGTRFPIVGQRTAKRRMAPADAARMTVADAAAPIARIFVLSAPGAAMAVEPLGPATAVTALTACTFVAGIDDIRMVRHTFDRVTSLVARVPVSRLVSVRDFARIDALCDAIRRAADID